MRALRFSAAVLAPVLLLSACASEPMGPTVAVMPAPGKPFDVFQGDQALCKHFATNESAAARSRPTTARSAPLWWGPCWVPAWGPRSVADGARRSAPAPARWAARRSARGRRRARSAACSSAMTLPIRSACIRAATRCRATSPLVRRPHRRRRAMPPGIRRHPRPPRLSQAYPPPPSYCNRRGAITILFVCRVTVTSSATAAALVALGSRS